MLMNRRRRSIGRATMLGLLFISLFPYYGFAQARSGGPVDVTTRHSGEASVGIGPLFALSGNTGLIINARLGGPLSDHLGLEGSLSSLVHPAYAGVLQGNLVASLVPDRWSQGKLVPFVTAGGGVGGPYGFFVVNYGGGAKYYFSKRWGVRFDVRDNLLKGFDRSRFWHAIELSGGLSFRF